MQRFDVLTSPTGPESAVRQYLTFLIGAEEYGVEILKVQEVKGYSAVTPLPNAPPQVKGLMNLRGTIIPVIDPRCRFGLPRVEYTRTNVIVVLAVGSKIMGLVVDAVSDVLSFSPNEIQETPDFGQPVEQRCVHGLARSGEKVVMLLDIDKVLGNSEE